jgi:predicted MFS family arabinose efflux permease
VGVVGLLGLLFFMKPDVHQPKGETTGAALQGLRAIVHPKLLSGALVTVFTYAGSFSLFTYVAPLLQTVTGVSARTVSAFMLAYGDFAALGNIFGGKVTDRLGTKQAALGITASISVVALATFAVARSPVAMANGIGT